MNPRLLQLSLYRREIPDLRSVRILQDIRHPVRIQHAKNAKATVDASVSHADTVFLLLRQKAVRDSPRILHIADDLGPVSCDAETSAHWSKHDPQNMTPSDFRDNSADNSLVSEVMVRAVLDIPKLCTKSESDDCTRDSATTRKEIHDVSFLHVPVLSKEGAAARPSRISPRLCSHNWA